MKRTQLKAAAFSLLAVFVLVVAACAPAATPTPTATPTPPPVVATPTLTPGVATPTPGVATPTPTPGIATPTPIGGMPPGYGYSQFGEWGMPLNMPPAQYGGTFRLGTTAAPSYFDQHRTFSANPLYITAPIFDNLIWYSPYMDVDIMPDTYRVEYLVPNLAEKWEVSSDGLMVTFYLKRGVRWHDGKPFTAKDVKYGFDKMLDPKRSVFTADLAMIDRMEVVDDYTIKFYLKGATDLFLLTLGMAQLQIQPEHLKDVSYRTTDFMVGTGPFKFKSYTVGVEYVLEKNVDYHFKGRPYFDGLKWHDLGTAEALEQALVAGQIDFINSASDAALALRQRVAPEIVVRYHNKLGANLNLWVSFVKEHPGQDVRVRKAMTMVLDRQALCIAAYGTQADKLCNPKGGYFVSAPTGRGLPWSEYEKAWLQDRPQEERVKEAKRLLTEAGYPTGARLSFLTTATPSAALLVALDQWSKLLNFQITSRIVPTAQVMDLISRGDFEIYSRGSVPFIGAMEQLVSNNYVKGGQTNYSFYLHPQVEELYQKLILERNYEEKLKIFHQIERLLIQDVPIIPLYTWNQDFMYWPYMKPKFFYHPVYHSHYSTVFTVTWFDRNDPTWAKRAK